MRPQEVNSGNLEYFAFIDGLRALAVLSVIVFHLCPSWLNGGFVGVDVFFVISGFIVSASMAQFKGRSFLSFLAFFYARRIRRIFPALIICLLVTGAVSALFIPASWLSDGNQKTGLYAFWGLSNFVLAKNGRDYFGPTAEFNPFTHSWSLAVEEQFYLIFPLLFYAWLYGHRGRYASVALYSVGLLASIIFSAWQSQNQPLNAYYLTPSRFWELACGVLLYQLTTLCSKDTLQAGSKLSEVIGTLSFTGLLVSFFISDQNNFPMPGALLAVISTSGIIFSLYRKHSLSWMHGVLCNRYAVLTGKLSYSLYLWHWPTFVVFRWTCGLDTTVTRIAALGITLVLAASCHYLVELPARRYKFPVRNTNPVTITTGLGIIFLSYWLATTIINHTDKLSLSVVMRNAEFWYPDRGPSVTGYPGCHAEVSAIAQDDAQIFVIKPEGCLKQRPFKYGVLHVIGDSHAMAYVALYKQFAIRNNLEVNSYYNGGCPFLSFQSERDIDDAQCMANTNATLRALHHRMRPGDVLFLPSLRLPRFGDQFIYFGSEHHQQHFFSEQAQANRQRSVDYAVKTLKALGEQGIQIVFEAPKLIFQSPPFRCSDWFNHHNPICAHGMLMARKTLQKYRAPVLASYNEVIKAIPRVSVWDPFTVLCPGAVCNVWFAGHSMFFDGDHISAYGSMKLLPDFTAFMLPKLMEKTGGGQGYAVSQRRIAGD